MKHIFTKKQLLPVAALIAAVVTLGVLLPACAAASAGERNTFTFSNSAVSASSEGTGYEIDGTALTITAAGTYTLTGSCAEGSVTVKKEVTGVTLVLDSLTLSSAETAPISCNKASAVTIQALGESTLTDSEDASTEADSTTFEGAAIKVKADATLTLSGDGILNLNGTAKNGVKGGVGASVTVSGLTLNVTAADNAVSSDGSVTVESGTLNLAAENDGLKSDPDVDDTESAGTVTINGGTLTVTAGGDGIQGANALTINDGAFTLSTGGGYETALAEGSSAKGLKSGGTLTVNDGTFTLDCSDDAIHAANVTLAAGTYTLSTGDDGVHADEALILGVQDSEIGPDVTVSTCVEGFEGASVTLYSGSGSVTASDDGINAANSDLDRSYTFTIDIYGGNWYVDAGGDALDSNGNINLYGGVTEVYGSANSGNAALDYDSSCNYAGGTLLAVGSSGMAQTPSDGISVSFGSAGMMGGGGGGGMGGGQRPQRSADGTTDSTTGKTANETTDGTTPPQIPANGGTPPDSTTPPEGGTAPDGTVPTGTPPAGGTAPTDAMPTADAASSSFTISAGSEIVIKDSAGIVLYTATGTKSANSVVFCAEALTEGETYTLYIDGVEAATAVAAAGTGVTQGPGGMGGGQRADAATSATPSTETQTAATA